ncbi:DNA repair protein recA homolog 2, mitochondrial [Quercus suber]|uniref:DNA repair protein recA homolog 2, mitochondrial n=1 Tax=Quercus suber TaxID=58331 RepID=UPI0032DF743A
MGFFTASLMNHLCLNAFSRRARLSTLLCSLHLSGRRDEVTSIAMNICHLSTVAEVSEFECDELLDDIQATKKDTALRLALSRLASDFGRESMLSLQRFFSSRRALVISTGSLKLDIALGVGGLPKGRIVEIYGREASGKTTLALHIIKEAQKLGGYCAYLDVENAMDPSLVESMGINTENLLISRPSSAENLLSVVNTLTRSGAVDVIVVDSVAALVPQYELDHMIGSTFQDMQSRIMTQALRKINYSLCQSQTLIVFLNQVRSSPKSGQGFGLVDEVTCGGNALKFYAAVRMKMIRTGLLKAEEKVTGLGVCIQVVKNNLAPSMKKAELGIQFGRGFCCEAEVLELACEHGVIVREGSNYLIEGKLFGGKHEAEQFLVENDGILDKIVLILRRQLFEKRKENHVRSLNG